MAEFELNALLEDTKSAVESLRRQQQSVMEAIQAAQQAQAGANEVPQETAELLSGVLERLNRLSAALDWVICQAEEIEAVPLTSGAAPRMVLPLPLAPALPDDHTPLEINSRT